jgi:alpha-L-rhamnosidase
LDRLEKLIPGALNIELENYFSYNPTEDKHKFRTLCYDMLAYFKPFENEFGLLEKLEQWNFIEWSDANKFVQDIHYPTNMLYAKVLKIIGQLFDDQLLVTKAQNIRKTIVKQSFNGQIFYDHAKRCDDGSIEILHDASEVCQYYVIFFGVANIEEPKYEKLHHLVYEVFGPTRKEKKIREDIVYANAFIGNYLRMEILTEQGAYQQVMDELKDYFSKMAKITGTLWENDSLETGSLNHGFASYIGIIITKIVLGIKKIDIPNKLLYLDFSYKEKEASGLVGTIYGDIMITRKFCNNQLITTYEVPEQFEVIETK